MGLFIHERINLRHPEITEQDVKSAWKNCVALRHRNFDPPSYYVAAGIDRRGRLLEMVGVELEDNNLLIYHCQKMTLKVATELELENWL